MVELTIADTISYLMSFYNGENIRYSMLMRLSTLATYYQQSIECKPGTNHADFINLIRDEVSSQWGTILSATLAYG